MDENILMTKDEGKKTLLFKGEKWPNDIWNKLFVAKIRRYSCRS